MDHATQVALTHRLFSYLERETTEMVAAPYVNPVSRYVAPERLARERELLFRREPLLLGLSADLAEPGSFLCRDESGIPILAVRTRAGELRAFVGICRHRGAQVVTGAGKGVGRFTCPYHGWTYDDGGKLIARPCEEGFAGLAKEDLCLRPLPVAERHGLIFARGSGSEPIDVDAHLGGAAIDLAALGLEHYAPFAQREIERALNWKIVIDTFLEGYHVPSLHRRTLAPMILGELTAWDSFGRSSRLIAARRSLTSLREKPESAWNLLEHAVVLWLVFPNTMVIHQIDHVEVVSAYPGDRPDSSRIVFSLYTPTPAVSDSARRHFQSNFDLLVRVTEEEDFTTGERMQRGFEAGGLENVVYGRNEPGLAHYHRALDAAVGEEAGC